MSGAPAELVLRRNHCRVPPGPRGLTTPTVNVPLPSQSPMTGVQPGAPEVKVTASVPPALASLRRNQVAVAGSKAPIPQEPLPSQSPTTGIQPGRPNWNGAVTSGAPEEFSLRRYQVMVTGSTTPTVV